jgi:hypothetical protein
MGATLILRSIGCFGVLSITMISNVCWALLGSQGSFSALLNLDTSDSKLIQGGNRNAPAA